MLGFMEVLWPPKYFQVLNDSSDVLQDQKQNFGFLLASISHHAMKKSYFFSRNTRKKLCMLKDKSQYLMVIEKMFKEILTLQTLLNYKIFGHLKGIAF